LSERPDDFRESLRKTLLLKQFAVRNGYKIPAVVLDHINELESLKIAGDSGDSGPPELPLDAMAKDLAKAKSKLDAALVALTSITFPITVYTLEDSLGPTRYNAFKRRLLYIGLIALLVAMISLVGISIVTETRWISQVSASVLAISLGLLGAVVYSFFSVLRVVPAQTFDQTDEYALYARLELGVLLGWVFYFGFARAAYEALASNRDKSQALYLMIPFIAGYSTKFVVGVLERIMAALMVALGIEDKKEARIKRTHAVAPDTSGSP
jgi:hypothetical protein